MKWNEIMIKLRGEKTIEEVTNDTGISPNTYEAFESGKKMPFDKVKEIIANYFGVNVSDIWKE